jgi:hypothetical protein
MRVSRPFGGHASLVDFQFSTEKVMQPNTSGSQEAARFCPIAIVGIGCRFPGGASDVNSFWDLLVAGRSGIRETPSDRWDKGRYCDSDPSIPGMIISRPLGRIP